RSAEPYGFFRGRPRFLGAAAGVLTTPLRLPGLGRRAPAIISSMWVEHRSFTKLPRATLIVAVSAAGRPHVSHTRIVFSAMKPPAIGIWSISPGRLSRRGGALSVDRRSGRSA